MDEPQQQRADAARQHGAGQDARHQLDQRIVALEESLMHTDRLLSDLNQVVCQLHDRLDDQGRQIELLKQQLQRATDDDEERSFEDERPPHY